MPLQNRVTPFGDLVALPGRGTLTGNRGVLHDDRRTIVRPWQVRRWIACRLQYGERRRVVMTPRRWTELFFLDEATALAAGHRPCAFCRYADYRRFRTLWQQCFGGVVNADAMDRRLDAERRDGRTKRTYRADVADVPSGTIVAFDGDAWLVWNGRLHRWTDSGYAGRSELPPLTVEVLTPHAMVAIMRAGYAPTVHRSIEGS